MKNQMVHSDKSFAETATKNTLQYPTIQFGQSPQAAKNFKCVEKKTLRGVRSPYKQPLTSSHRAAVCHST